MRAQTRNSAKAGRSAEARQARKALAADLERVIIHAASYVRGKFDHIPHSVKQALLEDDLVSKKAVEALLVYGFAGRCCLGFKPVTQFGGT